MQLPGDAMLVITANWGFTDGTLVAAGFAPPAIRAWLRRVRLAAIHAGFGRDGVYRPPDFLDIVLAGDTFDATISSAWRGRVRPWHGGVRVREARRDVLRGCVRRAAPLLAGLGRLVRRGLDVPADHRHRPSAVVAARVPVRVTLLVGDRDRNFAEAAFDVAARGAELAEVWSDGTVFVGHGHEADPACHLDAEIPAEDRPPTLGESLAVDLIAPFAATLLDAGTSRRSVTALVEALANAAPLEIPSALAAGIGSPGCEGEPDDAVRQLVVDAWCRAVDDWVRHTRRLPPAVGLPVSPVDDLAAWFTGAGTGRPPRALAELLEPDSRPTGMGLRMGTKEVPVVLGHPRRAPGVAAAICLGRPAVPRWAGIRVVRADGAVDAACVEASPPSAGPATIAGRRAGHRVEWHWSTGLDAAAAGFAAGHAAVVDAA